jgi:hypothetical protein
MQLSGSKADGWYMKETFYPDNPIRAAWFMHFSPFTGVEWPMGTINGKKG